MRSRDRARLQTGCCGLDAPDGGAISGLGCSLGYARYRSGDRERWIKTAGVDADAAERRPE